MTTADTLNDDPYLLPFNWAADLRAELDDTMLGMLPCGCDHGWWVLPDGSAIACDEAWRAA